MTPEHHSLVMLQLLTKRNHELIRHTGACHARGIVGGLPQWFCSLPRQHAGDHIGFWDHTPTSGLCWMGPWEGDICDETTMVDGSLVTCELMINHGSPHQGGGRHQ